MTEKTYEEGLREGRTEVTAAVMGALGLDMPPSREAARVLAALADPEAALAAVKAQALAEGRAKVDAALAKWKTVERYPGWVRDYAAGMSVEQAYHLGYQTATADNAAVAKESGQQESDLPLSDGI